MQIIKLRKCPECRTKLPLPTLFIHLILEHHYEEFIAYAFIDKDLWLTKFNEGYALKCPISGCQDVSVGSMELSGHLIRIHRKNQDRALTLIDSILRRKEVTFFKKRIS